MRNINFIKWIMKSNIRRWVLFLPISMICTLIASILWMILNQISMDRLMISTESFAYNIYYMPTSGIIAGFIFIYIGGYIAPLTKIGLILFALHLIYCCMSIYNYIFRFGQPDYWMVLFYIFCIVGSLVALIYLKNEFKE